MRPTLNRVARLSDWHRIKREHHVGRVVDAVAVRRVGFGALCAVGTHRLPAKMRSRENSWDPVEQESDKIPLEKPFEAVVVGYEDDRRTLVLSRKAAEKGPFEKFVAQHKVGDIVSGRVDRALPSEYILRLEGNIEAHLPKSAVPPAPKAAEQLTTEIAELREGDHIRAVVTEIDQKAQRIQLDVRAFLKRYTAETKQTADELRRRQVQRGVSLLAPQPGAKRTDGSNTIVASERLMVLLVEDRLEILSPVGWALKQRGHKVIAGQSWGELRQLLDGKGRPDVAVVDLQLRKESGETVCRELRGQYPEIRLYAFTGNPSALSSGSTGPANGLVDGVILKPVDMHTMSSYIEGRSQPPANDRMWALDQVLQSFVGRERLGEKTPTDNVHNALLDAHLGEIVEAVPGAKAAVLSLDEAKRTVTCVRALDAPNAHFAAFSRLLAFTPMADVLRDGKPMIQRVEPFSEEGNRTLREFMRLLGSRMVLGFPLHVESRRDPLGLFVFGPEDGTRIPREAVGACESVASSLAVAIERSMFDVELVRHQRAICVGSLMLGMTHELRNSLQSLDTYTHILEARLHDGGAAQGQGVPDASAVLANVRKQVTGLKENLEMFLGIVRVEEAGEKRLDEMLRDVVESCRATAEQDDIVVDLEMPDHEGLPMVPTVARQAFLNLLLNAFQHTSASGTRGTVVNINVQSEVEDEDGRRFVEVRVSDHAWGMHESDRERVFEMFFTTKRNGSGLGLYVTRLIIESLGGEVTVEETRMFSGTTFLIRLPLRRKKDKNHA